MHFVRPKLLSYSAGTSAICVVMSLLCIMLSTAAGCLRYQNSIAPHHHHHLRVLFLLPAGTVPASSPDGKRKASRHAKVKANKQAAATSPAEAPATTAEEATADVPMFISSSDSAADVMLGATTASGKATRKTETSGKHI